MQKKIPRPFSGQSKFLIIKFNCDNFWNFSTPTYLSGQACRIFLMKRREPQMVRISVCAFLIKYVFPWCILGPAGSLIKIVNVENLYADKQLHLLKVLANIMAPHHVRIVREKFFSQNHLDFSGHINYPKGKEERTIEVL